MDTTEAAKNGELWKLIMQMAEPTDLLRTILDHAANRSAAPRECELNALGDQSIVLQGCTVTIHQHITPARAAL